MTLRLHEGYRPIRGYKLVKKRGEGGFGEVWEAIAPGDVHVALKFIRLDAAKAGPELRGLEVIRDIRHPHLLDVQFAVEVEDCLVIAMPLCDQSLSDRLRVSREGGLAGVPRDELLGYMHELAEAIDYLNEPRHPVGGGGLVGIQHRDVKPHNVFLVGGSARLADFGLAKILERDSASHTRVFSPPYVAPEVLKGRVTRWSDQYSLGATYYHLRIGRPLFEGSVSAVIAGHLHHDPDLSSFPPGERAVVARALAKQAEGRWLSCREFARALGKAAEEAVEGEELIQTEIQTDLQTDLQTIRTVVTLSGPDAAEAAPWPSGDALLGDEPGAGKPGRRLHRWRRAAAWSGAALTLVGSAALLVSWFAPPSSVEDDRLAPPPTVEIARIAPPPRAEKTRIAPPLVETVQEPAKPPPVLPPETVTPIPGPVSASALQVITNSLGMKLVLIPAGEFLMGSPDDDGEAEDVEKPRHRVRITRPFYLGATEVTQGQYRAVTGQNPSKFNGSDDLPVEQVSWNEAVAFCNTLSEREGLKPYHQFGAGAQSGGDGYRLPTEAEWEYACRAGGATKYNFGDDASSLVEYAWFDGNSESKTHPVEQKRANVWGLYDMHGNVWEWCGDWYDEAYYRQSPAVSPTGPLRATARVARGGGWDNAPRYCRSADRDSSAPGYRGNCYLGFRVARVRSGS